MRRNAAGAELTVGVIGAGTMGRGIAQVAARGGCAVRLYDARDGAAEQGRDFVARMFSRAAEKGRMSTTEAEAATGRVSIVGDLKAFAGCDVAIEAVVEDLAVKQQVFAELEAAMDDDAVLASNTSSLSITSIAAACRRPERIAGFHFFNPVPLMPLVEVISGVRTQKWVADFLVELGERMDRTPVRVKDAPGFLVNQVGRGFTIEAAHLASEGVADFVDVDRVMRDCAGFRMGPFELVDLTALDVTHPATELIYEQFYHEPRFRPSPLMGTRLQAGLLGRKVGNGFYAYEDGRQVVPEEAPAPAFQKCRVWISPIEPDGHAALSTVVRETGAELDDGERPAADSLILTTPLGDDATTSAVEQGLDATRTLAVDTLFGLDRRRVLMKTPITSPEVVRVVHGLLASDGTPVTLLRDSPGFVAQRIVAMIVNIGAAAAQQRIASPQDVDRAVTLGLNYPDGPLAFGDRLGADKILRVLSGLVRQSGDPRYRPSPWLTRRARLGVSLLTPED